MPPGGGRGRAFRSGPKAKDIKGTILRVLRYLFKYYKWRLLIISICIIVSSLAGTVNSIFLNRLILIIQEGLGSSLDAVSTSLLVCILAMAGIYALGIITNVTHTRMMATVSQGFLHKMRVNLFNKMQELPIRYFDTHANGDIMSHYTNDVDTLRQLISQSIPHFITSGLTVIALFCYMIYLSVWMTLVVIVGMFLMTFVTLKLGKKSATNFIAQQRALGKVEGYIEETMTGQKVVKVFTHEEKSKEEFDRLNGDLYDVASRANKYANILMPIMGNIGNILYVFLAFAGGLLVLSNVPNLSLSGQALGVAIVVPFLNMTRQFSMNISQISQQANSIAMALAGAERMFEMMDEPPEADNGYVTLVNAKYDENGELTECAEKTGLWAWKHPHGDGTLTYTKVEGNVVFDHVDFGYNPDKIVLHDISLYANPGQKIAFVGATGAGKTTITNLINRFYDLDDGKIRYDGINVNKIKKADLRHSLGIVLQETNLFTGTVMENIRYGNLEATDEQCIEAAKLANAHDFITRLPDGYNTMLTGDGANLSQGQRQLVAIARAAVEDPPVMILDEATSSIDTRTELLVQNGMDKLMQGRTVFVIAHRLSTVQNSNVIMVLDHGRIIERGSHEDLIAQKGDYYQLYTGAFELE